MTEPSSDCATKRAAVAASGTGFAADVLKLTSGTVVALGLSAVTAPILARLYPPEAYGVAAVFLSITAVIGVVASLRYELSILLPETDEEAANLLCLSLLFTCLISLLSLALVFLLKVPLLRLLNSPQLSPFLALVPVAVFLSGAFLALNYWNTRTRKYGRLSIARVTNSSTSTAAQFAAGLSGHGTGGMRIGAIVLGSAVSTAVLSGQIWRDDRGLLRRSVRWQDMLRGLKRYRKFPLYDTWSALLNTISWQLPAFLLTAFFSPVVVGYYAFGFALLTLPMSLVGQAIGQVFFQRAAEARREGTLAALVESAFRRLVSIGMFPFLLAAVVGADVFTVALGPRWTEAGVYTQLLSLWSFFWFISSPLSTLLSVLEKQKFGLVWNAVNFTTRLGSLWLGGVLQNARLGLALFSASGVFVYGWYCFRIMADAGVPLSRVARTLLASFLLFLPAGAVLGVLLAFNARPWLRAAASAVLLVSYYTYVLRTDTQLRGLFSDVVARIRRLGSNVDPASNE